MYTYYNCSESVVLRVWNVGFISSFKDWEQAFSSILELPHAGKKLLVIDEFPYMARTNPSIPSILQNLWDERLMRFSQFA